MSDLERLAASKSHFELFSIEPRFGINRGSLHARYLELTKLTHPDAAGAEDDDALLLALELSARVNDAYAVVADDLRRAEYLLEIRGAGAGGRMQGEALARVFDLRDALGQAQTAGDAQGVQEIGNEAAAWLAEVLAEAGLLLDTQGADLARTRELVSLARYIQRIADAAR